MQTLLDSHLKNGSWPGRGLECTQLCLRSFVPTLERETFPSLHPGHTHVPLFPKSEAGSTRNTTPGNTVSLQRNLTLLPRGSVGLGLRSPASCPFYRLKACFQTHVKTLLWNYSMGCPCPRTKQPLLLFRLVINIIVNIAINSTYHLLNAYSMPGIVQYALQILIDSILTAPLDEVGTIISPFTTEAQE